MIFASPDDETVSKTPLDAAVVDALQADQSMLVTTVGDCYKFDGALQTIEAGATEEYAFGFAKIRLYKAYVEHEMNVWLRRLLSPWSRWSTGWRKITAAPAIWRAGWLKCRG